MSTTLPDALKDEFTQADWDNLTDAEREGMVEDLDDNGEPSPEEQARIDEEDKQREADALAAAEAKEKNQQPEKTDAEREAEAQAAAQAATEKEQDGKTTTTENSEENKADGQQEKQSPVIPRPRGMVQADLPEDYDQRVQANKDKRSALRKSYDNGDISFEEYEDQRDELEDERADLREIKLLARVSKDSSQQALTQTWENALTPFLQAHPEVMEDEVSQGGFDTYLREATAPVMQAGGMPGTPEIEKAYEKWCKRFNFTPANGKAETQQATSQAPGKPPKVPPTLGGVPSAATSSVEDGKFAALDRLEGPAYEEALAKLTPAEMEAYSQRG